METSKNDSFKRVWSLPRRWTSPRTLCWIIPQLVDFIRTTHSEQGFLPLKQCSTIITFIDLTTWWTSIICTIRSKAMKILQLSISSARIISRKTATAVYLNKIWEGLILWMFLMNSRNLLKQTLRIGTRNPKLHKFFSSPHTIQQTRANFSKQVWKSRTPAIH